MKQPELLTLERRISAERLAPYRAAVASDLRRAVGLYEKNTDISAAFWAVLCDLEILVRNAMHAKLMAWSIARYGRTAWYLDYGNIFNEQTTNDINAARRHLAANGRPETPGRVVAELSFGFWRFLLSSRYERSLWVPCLRGAFPGNEGRGMRRDVHDAMRELHLLRNRIAHHEPIHNRPLPRLHDLALTTAGWICPITRQWIAERSRVPELLRTPPDASPGRR
jgi:Abi-like protein